MVTWYTYMNNDYKNVNSTKDSYQIENPEQTENTWNAERWKLIPQNIR